MSSPNEEGVYIALISVHGLIRSKNLELGRDADTGGQTKYVVELAKAISRVPAVSRVDLITRRVVDPGIDEDYAEFLEPLTAKAQIVRIDAGPEAYLPKESLWEHLDCFTDNLMEWFNRQDALPNLLHSHYADAGYVATRISQMTGIPLVHTGHSLGRDKAKRLMATGMTSQQVDDIYNINQRIEAEEEVLANANLVITSTRQEITTQYELYDYYHPDTMKVIPPGTNLEQFHPPELGATPTKVSRSIRRFLDEPEKPMILALSRPDPRKNIATLVKAYGESKDLQDMANLVIVAGNRDDIRKMNDAAQSVLTELLVLIDYYDLYGKVAIPKKHLSEEVPAIYRLAASSRGVFVNPALTEPFGLTLLEAAASGLPFVATENGGPVDIVENCQAGILIDPLSSDELRDALKDVILHSDLWRTHSRNGIKNVERKYSWEAHAKAYLKEVLPLAKTKNMVDNAPAIRKASRQVDRLIFTELDKTLLSNTVGLKEFTELLRCKRKSCAFGIATARQLKSVLAVLKQYDIPKPDILISSLGTEIYYSEELTFSTAWAEHIDHNWNPKAIRRIFDSMPGLVLQDEMEQSRFKISYDLSSRVADTFNKQEVASMLRREDQSVNMFLSHGRKLDIVPARASKGLALRYVAAIWGIPMEHVLVAGGAGTDEDMMSGNALSVVVSNRHHEELEFVNNEKHIYYARQPNALGILEAIDHYNFFGSAKVREEKQADLV